MDNFEKEQDYENPIINEPKIENHQNDWVFKKKIKIEPKKKILNSDEENFSSIKNQPQISADIFLSLIYEDQNKNPDKIKCQICFKKTSKNKNTIILCGYCNGAIHQKCYGDPIKNSIPNGNCLNIFSTFLIKFIRKMVLL